MFVIIQLVLYGLATFIVVKVALFIRYYMDLCQKLRKLPHLPTHWLYGNLHQIKTSSDYVSNVMNMVENDGIRMYCIWFGPFPVVGVTNPELCKEVMHKESRKGNGFMDGPRLFKPWTGDGLIFSGGKKWARNRKLLTPAFHFDILKGYVTVMNDVSTHFLDTLWNEVNLNNSVDVFPYAGRATLDSMLRCSLSYEGNIQEEADNAYLHAVQELSEIIWTRLLNPILLVDFIFNWSKLGRKHKMLTDTVHDFTGPLIQARREQLKIHPDLTTCKRRLDFLDILLTAQDENGQHLTPQEVQDEVDTFTFAGHDTTASAVSWAIYSLAKYPDIQQKVYEDVHAVIGDSQAVTMEDIPQFEYLAQFLKEALRVYSPVPVIARRHTETIVIDGFEIPPGPRIDINLTAIHHNEAVWPDHKKFDPERFAKYHRDDTDNYGFVPFSASSRNCIGQQFALNELKITLAKFVTRFEVIRDDAFEDPKLIPDIIVRPSNGIHVKLKQR